VGAEACDTREVAIDGIDMLAVLRASQALSSRTQLADLQVALVAQLTALTGATDVIVALRDEAGAWSVPAGHGAPRPLAEAAEHGAVPLSAFRYAERTREPLAVDDGLQDARFAGDPYLAGLERCSLLVVPVLSSGELRALLVLANRTTAGAFTAERLDAVELITGQLAVSLGNALLYASLESRVADRTRALESANRQLETLSTTDALTGLANRRRFQTALDEQWRRARQTGVPLTVIMADIDHFKPYNDHYGHQQGDECLRLVAHALGQGARGADLVCRYGGEEFVVIVLGAGPGVGRSVGERFRAAVESLDLAHPASPLGRVTISVGVACAAPAPGGADGADGADGVDRLLARADAALYEAKRQGRNQVRCADLDPVTDPVADPVADPAA
jgi:diguanylate cyclase (GGDEF)-like protein